MSHLYFDIKINEKPLIFQLLGYPELVNWKPCRDL